MIVFQDLLSGQDIGTDSYPSKLLANGAVIAMESKKITVGTDEDAIAKATGANDSKEEGVAADKADSDSKQVINIVNAHDLQILKLDQKEFKTMQNKYWKLLKAKMDEIKYVTLGFKADYKPPADKKAAADAETAAEAKLDKSDKLSYANAKKSWMCSKIVTRTSQNSSIPKSTPTSRSSTFTSRVAVPNWAVVSLYRRDSLATRPRPRFTIGALESRSRSSERARAACKQLQNIRFA